MRYPPIPQADMTEEQRRVFDAIAGRSARGVSGPFVSLMHVPKINDHLERLILEMRFGTIIPEDLRVLAIMTVARNWKCQVEFYVHKRLAREAGLPDEVVEALAKGERPGGMSPDREMIYDFAQDLCDTGRVGDGNFGRVAERFGKQLALELTTVCASFAMLAMVLNVAETPLPPGAIPPFEGDRRTAS